MPGGLPSFLWSSRRSLKSELRVRGLSTSLFERKGVGLIGVLQVGEKAIIYRGGVIVLVVLFPRGQVSPHSSSELRSRY